MSLRHLSASVLIIVNLRRYETDQTHHPLQKTEDSYDFQTSTMVALTINSRNFFFFLLCAYISPKAFLVEDSTILSIKIMKSLIPCQSQYATVIASVIHF